MTIPVKDRATQVHMAAVVAKPMDRAIMTLRMEGIYRVVRSLAKDREGRPRGKGNHSSSRAVDTTYLGGLIDCCKAEVKTNALL